MAGRTGMNKNNSAVKRIMQEARELANDPCTDYTAAPLENDIFEWHCTLRGPPGTEFEGGLYHFRILLPSEYPFRPPSITMLTPNGRFELNTKICISFTSYHEELWQPAWGVRTAIIGLQGFFPLKGTAAVGVGALEYPAAERKRLAALSRDWVCPTCGIPNHESLPDPPSSDITSASSSEFTGSSTSEQSFSEQPATIANVKLVTAECSSSQQSQGSTASRQIPILAPTPTRPQVPLNIVVPPEPEPERPSQHPQRPTSVANKPRSPSGTERASSSLPAAQVQISSSPRPPVILDMAICALLVCVFALICRRMF